MMFHNSCPRCSGTLMSCAGELACLQCGARVYRVPPIRLQVRRAIPPFDGPHAA